MPLLLVLLRSHLAGLHIVNHLPRVREAYGVTRNPKGLPIGVPASWAASPWPSEQSRLCGVGVHREGIQVRRQPLNLSDLEVRGELQIREAPLPQRKGVLH